MAKVVRLIIYEGTNENLKQWLSRSMPDGIREDLAFGSIKLITLRSDIEWDDEDVRNALYNPSVREVIENDK